MNETERTKPMNEMTFEEEETQPEPGPTEILIEAMKTAKSRHKKNTFRTQRNSVPA